MEEAVTEETVDTTDADLAQTETTTDDAADNDQTNDNDTDSDTEGTEDGGEDDIAWADKKGVNLEDKATIAKMLRNADRKISEKSELQAKVGDTYIPPADADEVTALEARYNRLESKSRVQEHYIDNPNDRELDKEAVALLNEIGEDDVDFARALGRNLPKLFALVRSNQADADKAKAKDEGRKEERQALAKKQRASVNGSAARQASPTEDDFDSAFLKGFMNK